MTSGSLLNGRIAFSVAGSTWELWCANTQSRDGGRERVLMVQCSPPNTDSRARGDLRLSGETAEPRIQQFLPVDQAHPVPNAMCGRDSL